MKEFKYSLFAKLVYRFANLPVSLILFIHLIYSLAGVRYSGYFIISVIINIMLIILINRFYFKMYKYFPHKISADNSKIICTDFLNKEKKLVISHSSIKKITGGIFSKNAGRPIYITDSEGNMIGIQPHLKDFNKLLTIILSNINKPLYDELLEKLKTSTKAFDKKEKINNKKPAK
ncbi:MAG: hypothetical protein K9J16_03225 [Melioribacteraceae bacterium]|nr:hypothetical protein [Melioribacteraceae bacterium]MCF8353554.1 hypothetical protein [Melioribacteraceae bacterium]MCF8392512.1 hypothetical protein [Melioribacteraceae bacterium]MCF8418473.1 hypothetical protein [Melioribacteraceae bacterium]